MEDPEQHAGSTAPVGQDGSPGSAPSMVRNVKLSGRLTRCWTMAGAAIWALLLLGLCWSYSGAAFWHTAMPAVLGGAALIIGVMAGVRWWAYKATSAAWEMKPDGKLAPARAADGGAAEPSGTIICCSGGGIKSASFCLGALQALDEVGSYRTARAVVGVSGGGYTAAAYAALQYRRSATGGFIRFCRLFIRG